MPEEAATETTETTETVTVEEPKPEPEKPAVDLSGTMPEDKILDPASLRISRGPKGEARLEIVDDRSYPHFYAARLFPITHRFGYLTLSDSGGDEIGVLRNLRELPKPMRRLLLEELRKRYFVPQITYVYSLHDDYGVLYWDVNTTRGRRKFVVNDVRDHIREFPGGKMQVTDVDGNEFEIADLDRLPGKGIADLYRLL
ncbi:MAG: DUF1854 domain-containing protein [Armatimonadia bacterium]